MKKCPDALTIFLVPPSLEELERRIRGRRTESEDIVKERLDKARKEIQTKDEYKYVVENDDVHLAKDKIAKIINIDVTIVIRNIFLIDKRKEYVFYSFLLLTLFNCLLPNNFEFVEVLLN